MTSLHRILFGLIPAVCLLLVVLSAGCNTDNPVNSGDGDLELRVHQLINQYRASKGLSALVLNQTISTQAREHSTKMGEGVRGLGHDKFSDRVKAIKLAIPFDSFAENVAFELGSVDPIAAAVDGWVDSPEHLSNIEGDFDLAGVGIAQDKTGGYFFTQIFVKKK